MAYLAPFCHNTQRDRLQTERSEQAVYAVFIFSHFQNLNTKPATGGRQRSQQKAAQTLHQTFLKAHNWWSIYTNHMRCRPVGLRMSSMSILYGIFHISKIYAKNWPWCLGHRRTQVGGQYVPLEIVKFKPHLNVVYLSRYYANLCLWHFVKFQG